MKTNDLRIIYKKTGVNALMAAENIDKHLARLKEESDRLPPDPYPEFGEGMSAIFNALARSATFIPMEKGTRETLVDQKIPSQSNYDIRITGERLDEADRDVYLSLTRYYSGVTPGTSCSVPTKTLLTSVRARGYGGSNREWLYNVLQRLSKIHLQIDFETPRYKGFYAGNIFNILAISDRDNEENGLISFSIPPEFVRIFMLSRDYTKIPMAKRLALVGPGSQRAKWLHSIIYSHKGPFQRKLQGLYDDSGAKGVMRNFKISIKQALALLQKNGDIVKWEIARNKKKEDIVWIWKDNKELAQMMLDLDE